MCYFCTVVSDNDGNSFTNLAQGYTKQALDVLLPHRLRASTSGALSKIFHCISTPSIAEEGTEESFPTGHISSCQAVCSLLGWPVDSGSPAADQREEKYQARFAAG